MKLLTKAVFIILGLMAPIGCRERVEQGTVYEQEFPEEEPVWYLQPDSHEMKLYVREIGRGDTVLVVHGGFGAEHSYLIDALRPFFDRYHFVFYDQRGSLRSPAPDSLIGIDAHIADIEALRKALGIQKLNLLGHSMGTFLCGYYASKHPDKVGSMLLLALVYPKTVEDEEERARREGWVTLRCICL